MHILKESRLRRIFQAAIFEIEEIFENLFDLWDKRCVEKEGLQVARYIVVHIGYI